MAQNPKGFVFPWERGPPKTDGQKPLDTETVLNNPDLSRYGYRTAAPGPGEPGYSQDIRRDIANAADQSERSTEEKVAHTQSGSTPFTVFDYLGLGFILEPPGVLVHAVMTGEPLNWSKAWYALPFIAIGAASIYIGRNWDTLKQSVNANFANAVDRLSRAYVVPFIVVMFALGGLAILPILIWPPNNSASSVVIPSAEEIAAAVAKKMASQPAPTAPVATGDIWDNLKPTQQLALERALKSLPKRDGFQVICVSTDCKDLATSFLRVLDDADWTPVLTSGNGYYQEPVGLVLYQKDVKDRSLADAIEAATGIKVERIAQATQPTESIFIGVRM